MSDDRAAIGYGKSRLVLLPVDPYLVHVYWEIAPPENEAREPEEPVQPVLRFYQSGKDRPAIEDWFDIEVDLRCRSWYVHLWSPKESLGADLALRKKDGTLVRLARSPLVQMPRTVPAIAVDPHFVKPADAPPQPAISEQAEPSPPQQAPFQPARNVAVRSSMPKMSVPSELVRDRLKNLYDSLRLRRHDHVIEPEVPRPTGPMAPRRNGGDLTTLAERGLADNLSSSSLQKNQESSGPSSKR